MAFALFYPRALTLSKAEVPSPNMVQVGADGSLEGFGGIEQDHGALRFGGLMPWFRWFKNLSHE